MASYGHQMMHGLEFEFITQALNIDDTDPGELNNVTCDPGDHPDLVVNLHALPECAQSISMGNLTGGRHMAD